MAATCLVDRTSFSSIRSSPCLWTGVLARVRAVRKVSKSNVLFWQDKVLTNSRRDLRVSRQLRALGWSVVRIRECELKDPLRRANVVIDIKARIQARCKRR